MRPTAAEMAQQAQHSRLSDCSNCPHCSNPSNVRNWAGARINVNLRRFFSDERAYVYMWAPYGRCVQWLRRRLMREYGLHDNIGLICRGWLLPVVEPLLILDADDPVEVLDMSDVFITYGQHHDQGLTNQGNTSLTRLLEASTQTTESVLQNCPPGWDGDIADDDIADDGIADDGIADDGVADDGIADDNIADDAIADDGIADDGVADDGIADDNIADDAIADDGIADDDIADDGIADDGIADDGIADDGIADDGIADDGIVDDDIANDDITELQNDLDRYPAEDKEKTMGSLESQSVNENKDLQRLKQHALRLLNEHCYVLQKVSEPKRLRRRRRRRRRRSSRSKVPAVGPSSVASDDGESREMAASAAGAAVLRNGFGSRPPRLIRALSPSSPLN